MTTTALTLAPTTAGQELVSAGSALATKIGTEFKNIGGFGGIIKHCAVKGKDWLKVGGDVFIRSYNAVPQNLQMVKIGVLAVGTLYAAGRAITDYNIANETKALRNPMGSVALSGAQSLLNGGGAALGIAAMTSPAMIGVAAACPLVLVAAPLTAFAIRNYMSLAIGTHPLIPSFQFGVDNWLINHDLSQGGTGPKLLPSYDALRRKLDPMLGVNPIQLAPERPALISITGDA